VILDIVAKAKGATDRERSKVVLSEPEVRNKRK
jgi:hypothetical protein